MKTESYILTSSLDYERRFMDRLRQYGPNCWYTVVALQDWARADAREKKQEHLNWYANRQ